MNIKRDDESAREEENQMMSSNLEGETWNPQLESMNFVSPFSNDIRCSTYKHSITFAPVCDDVPHGRSISPFVPEINTINMEQSNFLYSFYCNPSVANVKIQSNSPPINRKPSDSLDDVDPVVSDLLSLSPSLPLSGSAHIATQPAEFQIANYNIYPSPLLQLDVPLLFNRTVYISLVEASTGTVIPAGFQSGDVRILRPGTQQIQFTGLKLNKKKVINSEVRSRKFNQYDCNFKIRFTIGNQHWYTESFKLVSSYSQLPNEVRDYVRPSKLTKRPSPIHMPSAKAPRLYDFSPPSNSNDLSSSSSSSFSP